MRTPAEIDQVLDAIREEDPAEDDETLRAYAAALEWAAGRTNDTAEQFIDLYVLDAG